MGSWSQIGHKLLACVLALQRKPDSKYNLELLGFCPPALFTAKTAHDQTSWSTRFKHSTRFRPENKPRREADRLTHACIRTIPESGGTLCCPLTVTEEWKLCNTLTDWILLSSPEMLLTREGDPAERIVAVWYRPIHRNDTILFCNDVRKDCKSLM